MKNFTFQNLTKVLFGAGQLDALHAQVLPGKRAMIATTNGKSVKANGYLDRLIANLIKQVLNIRFLMGFARILPVRMLWTALLR